ncbi:MAG: PEP-CTERM sorting domain-containing protein [Chthonomonas sp.]|nr:PEP-CTERM sorting domain-containing protein [Chthonomonas sp.]
MGNDTRERQLANATTKVLSGTNAVEYNYIGNLVTAGSAVVQDVDAQTCYQLTDTGPNTVRLYTYLCFNNRSAATITANGFCVFDFDVDGTIGNDVVQPLFSTSALKSWTMTDGLSTGRLTGPGCFGAAAGTASQIAAAMTNGSVDTFFPDVNAGGIATPGNYLLGLEFQTILFPGQSVCFPVYIDFGVNGEVPPIVPEPSTLAMAGVAIGAFVLRRRRR